MAWITATTLDDKSANLQSTQIAAILERVPNQPQDGSTVIFAASGLSMDFKESPAELLRAIDTENPPASPGNIW